jgi:hypothetical protein
VRNSATSAPIGQSATSRWRSAAFVAAMLILTLGALTTPAAADTLVFTDLGPGCSPNIPAVYHGLNWSSNFQLECNSDYASSYGNSYGAASGYAATNGGSLGSGLSELSISSGTFDFVGADFSSFAGSNSFQSYSALSLQIYAYRPGDTVDNPTFVTALDLDPTQYVTTTLNFTGIDDLFFGAGNGPATNPNTIFGVDGLSWLMTDAEVNLDQSGGVPEPDSILLLGTGLAVGLLVRRRVAGRAPKGSLKP